VTPVRPPHPAPPTVFLDRDGVINRDSPDYVKGWDEFVFLPGSLDALRRLTEAGHRLVVVTNQSGVGRGLIPPPALADMHRRMTAAVARAGGRLLDVLHCPHLPSAGCPCRKPRPGLVAEACRRHGLDPAAAVMVGDRAKDVLCGRRAGCGATVLVAAGDAAAELAETARQGTAPDHVAPDLAGAAEWILARSARRARS